MATLILKSLLTGYIVTAIGAGILIGLDSSAPIASALIMPIFIWPATLIISGLAMLVFLAINENK